MPVSLVRAELIEQIRAHGRITFAEFMATCLYSAGGFYSSRARPIGTHFRTSPASHPSFGALIARQLEEMWRLLGRPPIFHTVEVGSGEGALARSIVTASAGLDSQFAAALRYVATDYTPWLTAAPAGLDAEDLSERGIQRVRASGLQGLRGITGCILSNELLDNSPIHRIVVNGGRLNEVFVGYADGEFFEILDEPSTPRLAERLASLGVSLPEQFRGEINLDMDDWTRQIDETLERGFVLTIDYGQLAEDLYSTRNAEGTLICFQEHVAGDDPYRAVGGQDITADVDFTSLMRLGEQRGLRTVGYALQRDFLERLGFQSSLVDLETRGLSEARVELRRRAMMELVDPEGMGNFKVLAQAKGMPSSIDLLGFTEQGPRGGA